MISVVKVCTETEKRPLFAAIRKPFFFLPVKKAVLVQCGFYFVCVCKLLRIWSRLAPVFSVAPTIWMWRYPVSRTCASDGSVSVENFHISCTDDRRQMRTWMETWWNHGRWKLQRACLSNIQIVSFSLLLVEDSLPYLLFVVNALMISKCICFVLIESGATVTTLVIQFNMENTISQQIVHIWIKIFSIVSKYLNLVC